VNGAPGELQLARISLVDRIRHDGGIAGIECGIAAPRKRDEESEFAARVSLMMGRWSNTPRLPPSPMMAGSM
jgi:hypothetical protein